MKDCELHRMDLIDRELGGSEPRVHPCAECDEFGRDSGRILRAGRALAAGLPSEEFVEAAKARFLSRLASGGGAVVGALLLFAGASLLAGVLALASPEKHSPAAAPLLAAGAGAAGAALVVERARDGHLAPTRAARSAIMSPCAYVSA